MQVNNPIKPQIKKMSEKIYQCDLCGREFEKHNLWWYHKNKSKKLCIPKETVLQQLDTQKGKIKLYQQEIQKLEKKIEIMQEQLDFYKNTNVQTQPHVQDTPDGR